MVMGPPDSLNEGPYRTISFANLNDNHTELFVSPIVKVDSSPSITNHAVYSRVCYSSNPDECLSSCGVTVKRQEAVKPTRWSERPYFINNLSPFTLFNVVREFSSVVSCSYFPWVANHLAYGTSLNLIYTPVATWSYWMALGFLFVLQETYKHIGFTLTTLNLSFGNH